MKTLPKPSIVPVAAYRIICSGAFLASCWLSPAYAYDSAKLATALDSLSLQTFPDWEKQAREGNAVAQNVLGMAYKYGEGGPQDDALSLNWFKKAAQQGDADAQFNLGRIYGIATGPVYGRQRAVPRDDVTAAYWYRKAAEQGYTPAQLNLGQMYAQGSPAFPRDLAQAHFWLQQAAAGGDPYASTQLAALESEMSVGDKDHARESAGSAGEWTRHHR